MAKGAIGKENVIATLKKAFGADYIGEQDKKIYVWADDGGERCQIAISLTCPKNQLVICGIDLAQGEDMSDWDFSDDPKPAATARPFVKAEISDEEKATVADLMARLGL